MIKTRYSIYALATVLLLGGCQTVRQSSPVKTTGHVMSKVKGDVVELVDVFVDSEKVGQYGRQVAQDLSRPAVRLAGSVGAVAAKGDMAYLDKDGDMRLTLDEYRNGMTSSGAYRLEASRHDLTVERFVRAEFYITDVNQDGFIDTPELTGLRRRDLADKRDAILSYRPY